MNSRAAYRPSGVEWLGDVPGHCLGEARHLADLARASMPLARGSTVPSR